MSKDLGNRAEDSVIAFTWDTNDADGASITRATDGTISVYKDDNTTQSVAGVTDVEDFDSLTGVHNCKIDLSADAFYATGCDYSVVLSAATIDGETVNATIATFSIEHRFMRGTDSAALASVCTEGRLAELDAANLPTTTDDILTDTAEIGTAGAGLTDLGGMSAGMKAEVNAEADTAISDYDPPTNAEMEARTVASATYGTAANQTAIETDTQDIQSRLPAALVSGRMDSNASAINDSNSAAVRLALSAGQIIPGTVDNDVAPSTTIFEADDITEATADHYNGRIVIFTSGNLAGQATDITDYELNGSNGKFTVTAMTEAPANDDTFVIV